MSPLPTWLPDRIVLALKTGYLATRQHRGCGQWQQQCMMREIPFIVVEPYRRKWLLRIEMGERWRFTELGERVISALASEHTDRISTAPDYAFVHGLPQEAAELIAGRVVYWRRSYAVENEVQS